jgi:hypothetical protein
MYTRRGSFSALGESRLFELRDSRMWRGTLSCRIRHWNSSEGGNSGSPGKGPPSVARSGKIWGEAKLRVVSGGGW